MRRLFSVVVIVLILIAAIGYYQGWFHYSTTDSGHQSGIEVTIDKDKVRRDNDEAKEKLKELDSRVREKIPSSR